MDIYINIYVSLLRILLQWANAIFVVEVFVSIAMQLKYESMFKWYIGIYVINLIQYCNYYIYKISFDFIDCNCS